MVTKTLLEGDREDTFQNDRKRRESVESDVVHDGQTVGRDVKMECTDGSERDGTVALFRARA